ncbi:MAG: hypothetical protein IPG98_10790 [Burkholderiales bacterium]|nr:hypothetical protein [Burkholderiales bacterium]MBK8664736.1 hypothetical protein [Burkholderiales bacterium]
MSVTPGNTITSALRYTLARSSPLSTPNQHAESARLRVLRLHWSPSLSTERTATALVFIKPERLGAERQRLQITPKGLHASIQAIVSAVQA